MSPAEMQRRIAELEAELAAKKPKREKQSLRQARTQTAPAQTKHLPPGKYMFRFQF